MNPKKIIYVQSVMPEEIVKELKIKTKQSSVLEAVSIAVYHYLKCQKEESNEIQEKTGNN
jgi:hypothetical protein